MTKTDLKQAKFSLSRCNRALLLLLVLLLPTGCHSGTLKDDKELKALLSDMAKRNEALETKRRDRLQKEFRAFHITLSSAGVLATMDLADAPADIAFTRLMTESGTPFRMGDVILTGRVTVKAVNVPLLEAVRAVTGPLGVIPQLRGDTLTLNYAPPALPPSTDTPAASVTRSFVLRYLTPDTAWNLLNDLLPAPRAVNFAKVPDLQSIYLSGPEDAVQQATDLLIRADRSPGAVQIEAIMVGVNSSAYEEFNSAFNSISKGRISGGKVNVWALQESSLEYTYDKAAAGVPLKFSSVMNMLFQQEKARVIARPFITTMSGQEADMNIGEDRFVVVQSVANSAAVYSPQAIKAGIQLKVTPMVLGENMVRLNILMSNRQFVPSQGNIDQIMDNSSAQTVLTLENGQTAIIGGLKMKTVSTANAGLPWFRRIPLLNLLTAAHEENQLGQEVFFYLTPHIIKPGLDALPDRPEAFGITNDLLTPVEKLQR